MLACFISSPFQTRPSPLPYLSTAVSTAGSLPSTAAPRGTCEPMNYALCKDLSYSRTAFPNLLGHVTQSQAGSAFRVMFAHLARVCPSPLLRAFLCSLFFPVCTAENEVLRTCGSLCHQAQTDCSSANGRQRPFMFSCRHYSRSWHCFSPPSQVNKIDKYSVRQSTSSGVKCRFIFSFRKSPNDFPFEKNKEISEKK